MTSDNVDIMRLLLEYSQPEDITAMGDQGTSLLHQTARRGRTKIMGLLIRHLKAHHTMSNLTPPSQEANDSDNTKLSPRQHTSGALATFADELTKASANLFKDKSQQTSALTKFDINALNASSHTAMHLAAENGHTDMIKLLIAEGANIDTADNKDRTPLHYSILYDQDEVRDLLINTGADLTL
jgi:ankyrin repeat protein